MALHRRKIKSALEKSLGWDVKTHVSGIIDVYPPTQVSPEAGKNEVVARVQELGYQPHVIATTNGKGETCIQFHTPETLEQEGEGSHGFKKQSND